jgi:hypothetical protein
MRDRIWLPHACTRTPTRVLPELHALTVLYEACQPHHPYRFEPQSAQYLAHGDLWDHLQDARRIRGMRSAYPHSCGSGRLDVITLTHFGD